MCLLAAFVFLQSFLPLNTAIQIGADEGFELAKATLCLNGYNLYTEVWNDQPPLHTFLITQILKYLTPSIRGPRLLTLVFTALLLTSVFFISLRVGGLLVAALTTALLITSPGFIELSASSMLEIPGLAPAVAALGVLLVGRQSKWHVSEILSGVLFGVTLEIKLVNLILLPLAALIVWLRSREMEAPRRVRGRSVVGRFLTGYVIRRGLLLTGSLAISFVAIDYVIDRGAFLLHFQQPWSSHFASAKSFEYGSANEHPFDRSIFLKNWDTTIPALLGIVFLFPRNKKLQVKSSNRSPLTPTLSPSDGGRVSPSPERSIFGAASREKGHFNVGNRTALMILPLAWLALTLVVFATHKPWWSYYYIHIAIPVCGCAAIGIAAVWQEVQRRRHVGLSSLFVVLAICMLGWMGARVYLQISGIRHSPQTYSSLVLGEIERLKPFARFIYTDESIYSFHARIPLPPDLAVLSLKRFWSGDMTNARVAEEMGTIKPEVILLRNDTRAVPFQELLDAEYRVVYQDTDHRLYTKKALAKQAGY